LISSLDLLAPQSKIFIDTNIFLYGSMDYTKYRATCRKFLQNIESGAYLAATSALVLNEIVHKLILAETTKTYQLRSESEAKKLIDEIIESEIWNYDDDDNEATATGNEKHPNPHEECQSQVDAARQWQSKNPGKGDYSKERSHVCDLGIDEIFQEIERMKKKKTGGCQDDR